MKSLHKKKKIKSYKKNWMKNKNNLLEIEQELANETQVYYNLTEDTEKYRMYLGKVKVKGNGVQVTLADADYNPNERSC